MAWDLGGNHGAEIGRALALGVMVPERVNQLYPAYPGDRHPYIVESNSTSASAVEATHLTSASQGSVRIPGQYPDGTLRQGIRSS